MVDFSGFKNAMWCQVRMDDGMHTIPVFKKYFNAIAVAAELQKAGITSQPVLRPLTMDKTYNATRSYGHYLDLNAKQVDELRRNEGVKVSDKLQIFTSLAEVNAMLAKERGREEQETKFLASAISRLVERTELQR